MRSFLLAVITACAISVATAQEYKDFGKERINRSPRHAEWVDIKSGDKTIKAYVVYPERKDKAPVVIVTQEIFGLTDWLRSMCDELAENGMIAIAPDFLNGQKFEDGDAGAKATSALTPEQIKSVLDATSEYALTKIPAANGTTGHLRILPGWRLGIRLRDEQSEAESGLLFLRNDRRRSGEDR